MSKLSKFFFYFLITLSLDSFATIKMAITIDDLPVHGILPPGSTRYQVAKDLVEIFKKHEVPEVYAFINAGNIENKDDTSKAIKVWLEAGYPLGNHTFTHMSLNNNSTSDFIKEIALNDDYLKSISSNFNWKYFRYPYLHEGDTLEKRNTVRKFLHEELKYKIAQVTVDFNDWAWNDPYARCVAKGDINAIQWLRESFLKNATEVLTFSNNVAVKVFNREIPHILLLHVGALDVQVMDQMLANYKKIGVEFIPLSEAIKDPIYAIDPGITFPKWGAELQFQVLKARGKKVTDLGIEPYRGFPEDKLKELCL